MPDNYIMLSAVIDDDTSLSSISVPINSTYSLECRKYTISRKNSISKTNCISKDDFSQLSSTGNLVITAEGEVCPSDHSDFISSLSTLSASKAPFTLVCRNQSYNNMILSRFSAEIENYEKCVKAELVFEEI